MDGTRSTEKVGDNPLNTDNQEAIEETHQEGAAVWSEGQAAFLKHPQMYFATYFSNLTIHATKAGNA